jgi:hypothetical protein
MLNQRFFQDRKLSFSYFRPKKLKIFVYEAKFLIEPTDFLSDLKFFDPKAIM